MRKELHTPSVHELRSHGQGAVISADRSTHLPFLLIAVTLTWFGPTAHAQDPFGDPSLDSLLSLPVNKGSRNAFTVTSAIKGQQTIREAVGSISVITSEDILRYGYETIGDILNSVPGFYTSNDRQYEYLGIRGFGRPGDYNSRLLFMLNGHVMNEMVYGSSFIGREFPFDPHSIDRVEIIRGAQGLFGNAAMLALVNIITKSGSEINGVRASGGMGSFGTIRGMLTAGAEIGEDVEFSLSAIAGSNRGEDLYFPEFDAPETNFGMARGLDAERYYGVFTNLSFGALNLAAGYTRRSKDNPTGSWESMFNVPGSDVMDERGFADIRYKGTSSSTTGYSLTGFFDYYGYIGSYIYDLPAKDNSYDRWMGLGGSLYWDVVSGNRVTIGAEFVNHASLEYQYWTPEELISSFSAPFSVASLFLQDEYQATDNLSMMIGARFDKRSSEEAGFTPRLGVAWLPSNSLSIKALYANGFRLPSAYEILYEDPYAGYKQSLDLQREQVHTVEGIVEYLFGEGLLCRGSLYYYRMNDLIDAVIDPVDSLVAFKNAGSARSHGLELEWIYNSDYGVTAYLGYSVSDTRWVETASTLTNYPTHIATCGFSLPTATIGIFSMDLRYESARKTIHDTWSDPFFLVNTRFVSAPLFSLLRFSISCRNLFDTAYSLPASQEHVQILLPQTRRVISATMAVQL